MKSPENLFAKYFSTIKCTFIMMIQLPIELSLMQNFYKISFFFVHRLQNKQLMIGGLFRIFVHSSSCPTASRVECYCISGIHSSTQKIPSIVSAFSSLCATPTFCIEISPCLGHHRAHNLHHEVSLPINIVRFCVNNEECQRWIHHLEQL